MRHIYRARATINFHIIISIFEKHFLFSDLLIVWNWHRNSCKISKEWLICLEEKARQSCHLWESWHLFVLAILRVRKICYWLTAAISYRLPDTKK